jgi:hypothetical protein
MGDGKDGTGWEVMAIDCEAAWENFTRESAANRGREAHCFVDASAEEGTAVEGGIGAADGGEGREGGADGGSEELEGGGVVEEIEDGGREGSGCCVRALDSRVS